MSKSNTLISVDNLQTVVAVCFVLALMSVAFNFYNFTRVQQTEALAIRAASVDTQSLQDGLGAARQEIADLREEVTRLEQQLADQKAQQAQASAADAVEE